MNEVVANMTKMPGRILGEDIELQLNYSPHPARVQADAGMMEQVLLNLAVNSRDAMPRGGLLAIKIPALRAFGRDGGAGTRCADSQSRAKFLLVLVPWRLKISPCLKAYICRSV